MKTRNPGPQLHTGPVEKDIYIELKYTKKKMKTMEHSKRSPGERNIRDLNAGKLNLRTE